MQTFVSNFLVQLALIEDIGQGDLTTNATIAPDATGNARVISREPLIVCGQEVALEVVAQLHHRYGLEVSYQVLVADGTSAPADTVLATMYGSLRAILTAERTLLNFLQHLSGIATYTRAAVERSQGKAQVLDTRKTTPGYRELEKYAVRVGGGTNHRYGLYDAVLIKNNHIDALAGDIIRAVKNCRDLVEPGVKVQVEVRNDNELTQAIEAAPDAVLLDNMTPDQLKRAVETIRRSKVGAAIQIEASGGITLETVARYASTGVDFVSMGSLTHSARAVDISLRIEQTK